MRFDAQLSAQNNHDGTFTDVGLESGVALNEDGMEQAGMGLGIGDYQPGRQPGHPEDSLRGRHRQCCTGTTAKAISKTSPTRPD